MANEKDNGQGKTAPLRNVELFLQLVKRVQGADRFLPNWGCFYGVSGRGKSTAAAHAALSTGAVLLECGSTWSTGTLVDFIGHEIGLNNVKGPVSKRVTEIIRILSDDPRPLIFDEADHLVKKSLVDVVREIADKTRAPIIFIGEQHLPTKLAEFERAHNRVLEWTEAVPCGIRDAKALLGLYGDKITIADDLLEKIVKDTQGSARRIVINIDRMREFARTRGLTSLNLAAYMEAAAKGGIGEIYKGTPQLRHAGKAAAA